MSNFKRLTAYILALALVITSLPGFSSADILITEDVVQEQDLRFSVTSDTQDTSIDVPFPDTYKNVQVISSEVDNGRIESTSVNADSVTVNLDNGTASSQPVTKTITHSETIPIVDKTADSSSIISISASPECKSITAITGVSSADGCLKSASGIGTTTLKVLADPSKGKDGYDYSSTTDKYIDVSAPSNNRNKAYTASAAVTPYKSAYVNEADKNGSTLTIDTSNKDTGGIAVSFMEGKVTRNINTNLAYSCPKRWVDRHQNLAVDTPSGSGGRKPVRINPKEIEGIPYDKFVETNTYAKPSNVDFWGYYIGRAPGNNNVSYPTGADNLFLCCDKLGLSGIGSKTFKASEFDKYDVDKNSAASVIYDVISTGIRTTCNAEYKAPKEAKEAQKYESQDTFYDPLYLGELKTKVYHWYYWAGIDTWGVFGGYYTYPYKARVHYLAYNPAKLYNGSVTYEYQEQQIIPGGKYNYSGKIRIRYTITRTILDKPPAAPGGIIATKDRIMNGASWDDYTPEAQIRYRYYYYKNNTWNYLGEGTGTREYAWNPASLALDLLNLKVGVVAVDSRGQVSGRAENDPNAVINLTGSLSKTVVQPGEAIDIYAETDSNPLCYEVSYNIENTYGSGLMEKTGKKPYEARIAVVAGGNSYNQNKGKFISWTDVLNVHVKPDGEYEEFFGSGIKKDSSGTAYTFGNQGTVIMPDLNPYGYQEDYAWGNYASKVAAIGTGQKVFLDSEKYYYIANTYTSIYDISPYKDITDRRRQFGMVSYLNVSYYNSSYGMLYRDSYRPGGYRWGDWNYINGVRTYMQIWDKTIDLPYWNQPVAVTFNGNIYNVYQAGSFIGQVTANRTMNGEYPNLASFVTRVGEQAYSSTGNYAAIGTSTGKHVISDRIWSIDQINTFMSGAYNDNFHINESSLFRQPAAYQKDQYGSRYIDYGGVCKDGGPHPADLYDYLPGRLKWNARVTLPANITGGFHTITLTAKNGLQKSVNLTFLVDIPEVLNPKGVIPYYVTQGKTYTAAARTTTQADSMNLIVFGTTYPMTFVRIDSSDPDYPGGAKCWTCNLTIPAAADYGLYNQVGGARRMAEFKASSASGRTESDFQPFNVLLALNPIGDIPDTIETKTNWKARCTTNAAAASVTVQIDPNPGSSPYNMTLVSSDGSHKYWETTNLKYPEGAGSSTGRIITGIFTARGPNNSVETDTDTGMLYEKIEVLGYELRRYLFRDGDTNRPVVETLCRSSSTRQAGSAGFIMAGWEMGIKVITKGYVDRIEYDFEGPFQNHVQDSSIKVLDRLTKRFEWEDPKAREKAPFGFSSLQELERYYMFPKEFKSAGSAGSSLNNIYTEYYLIPYGTKQSLQSWYTLRAESGNAFNIDKSRLLERIKEPFALKLKIYSGKRYITKEIKFDVFERWDTLLNRDIRPYIDNPGEHDPLDKHYWETTSYVEH